MSAILTVRLRGSPHASRIELLTLLKLGLKSPNACVVMPDNPSVRGMLKRVSKFLTWGEAREDTLVKMLMKRGKMKDADAKKAAAKFMKEGRAECCNVFRLSPPSKGLKSAKIYYPLGDLGNRGEKINDLVERMM